MKRSARLSNGPAHRGRLEDAQSLHAVGERDRAGQALWFTGLLLALRAVPPAADCVPSSVPIGVVGQCPSWDAPQGYRDSSRRVTITRCFELQWRRLP